MPVDRLVGSLGGGLLDDAIARALGAVQPSPEAVIGQDMVQQEAMQAPTSFSTPQDLMNDRQKYAFGFEPPAEAEPRPDFPVGVDRIGAERGTPDLSEVPPGVPQDPYPGVQATPPPPDPYAPLGSPQTTQQATQQANDSMVGAAKAQTDLELAKQRALSEQQGRIADVYQRSADTQLAYMNDYKQERAAIQAKADVETAAWLQDLQNLAAREPNPNRWWNNQSGLSQALWAMGMVFGAINAGLTPGGSNAALAMVQKEIDKDVDIQKAVTEREMAIGKLKGSAMKDRHARNDLNLRDDYSAKMTRLQSLERAWTSRATAPGDADAAVAKQAGIAWLAEQKSAVAERYRQEKAAQDERLAAQRHQERMAGAQRAFQAAQAKADREFQDAQRKAREAHDVEMENLGFGHKLALSPVEIGGAMAPGSTRNPIGKDGKPLYDQLATRPDAQGKPQVVVQGGSATDGAMLFSDHKDFEGANATIEAADEHFHALVRLRNALSAQSAGQNALTSLAGVTDPELNSAIMELGGALAKAQNGGRPTDKDFSNAIQQTMGFDANGNWLQRGKFTVGSILPVVQRQIDEHTKRVQAKLQGFNNEAVNGKGSKVIYRPADLAADTVPQQNAREAEGKGPVTLAPGMVSSNGAGAPLKGADDYRQRRAAETAGTGSQRGYLLSDHDRGVVDAVMARAQNTGPATIRAKATETLDALKEQKAAADAQFAAATDPWNRDNVKAHKAFEESARLAETINIVETVSKDLEAKAAKALDSFKGNFMVKLAKDPTRRVSEETVRKAARDVGLTDATEVEEYINSWWK